MKTLAFKPGERVADIGAGQGYRTSQVADAVGPEGQVLALDIAPEKLEYLDLRAKARNATNVTLRRVASDDPQLEPGSVDTILRIDAIHYILRRVVHRVPRCENDHRAARPLNASLPYRRDRQRVLPLPSQHRNRQVAHQVTRAEQAIQGLDRGSPVLTFIDYT